MTLPFLIFIQLIAIGKPPTTITKNAAFWHWETFDFEENVKRRRDWMGIRFFVVEKNIGYQVKV